MVDWLAGDDECQSKKRKEGLGVTFCSAGERDVI